MVNKAPVVVPQYTMPSILAHLYSDQTGDGEEDLEDAARGMGATCPRSLIGILSPAIVAHAYSRCSRKRCCWARTVYVGAARSP